MINQLKNGLRKVASRGIRASFRMLSVLPRKEKVVIFESFHGKQFSCNPRAIYEYMKVHRPDYTLYWSVHPSAMERFEDRDINILPRFSPKWIYYTATAKYWVINARLPKWMSKPAGTVYVQTWHGTPLKKLGIDIEEIHMPGTTTEKYKENFLAEASKWDYLIAPNDYSSDIFKRAFGFDQTMLKTGYPRNDVLHQIDAESFSTAFKKKHGISPGKKVLLYAPTWRDDEFFEVGKYKFSLKMDLDKMMKEIGDEYILLLRMHYLVAENLDISAYEGFAYNFSDYEDIRDLYLAADVLITDYSSVFFDYANVKRPMIFFAYDIEKYRDTLRGFYFDFEQQTPGPIVKTTEELLDAIAHASAHQDEAFYKQFCSWEDGKASERVVDQVFPV